MRKRAFAVERGKMHDAGAGFQRAEEVDGMIGRIAEEQRHRGVLAVAGAKVRRGGLLNHRFQFGVADGTVTEFDRRPRPESYGALRQQLSRRPAPARMVPTHPCRIELSPGWGHRVLEA